MENITIDFSITSDQIIAIAGILVSIVIALIGGIYAIVTNTKKYELTETYRVELLNWYSETVLIMSMIIHFYKSGEIYDDSFQTRKTELLSQLSAQIEVGRFYFPNVIKSDGYGKEKPSAYQGYRHINLEFLLHFYTVASRDECIDRMEILENMERYYTSVIFDTIEPRKRSKLYSKYTELTMPEGRSMWDFLDEDPENVLLFWRS